MDNKQKSLALRLFLGLVILLIIINMARNYYLNRKRQANIYNVMGMVQTPITYKTQGVFVFDEFVIDAFEDTKASVDDDKLVRDRDKIIDTTDSKVNYKLKKQKTFLDGIKAPTVNSNEITSESLDVDFYTSIYHDKISDINLNYVDSLNEKFKYHEIYKNFVDSFFANDTILVNKTGFYISKLDGYESIINSSNIDSYTNDKLNFTNLEKDKLNVGLKYVNNKEYYILTQVENFEKYEKLGITDLSINMDGRKYYAASYEIQKDSEGISHIKIKMHEGLDRAIKKRISEIDINFNTIKTINIPTSAIYELNGRTGVYTVDSGVVEFAPVKEIYRIEDMSCVYTNPEDVYPQSYLDKVEENNKNLLYDSEDKNYIKLTEIQEYSNILLDKASYKVGDRY